MPQALPVGPLVVYLGDEPPGTSDDSATIRARRGYLWLDRSKPALWVCVDPAEGAAVWYRLGNAEDLAAIALSGSWDDLSDTPTTLAGYGITDAATDADLTAHKQATDNPHQVTAAQVGAPPISRTISTGTGLEGGGDLSEDRTISLSAGTLDSLGRADSAVQPGDLAAIATSGSWADLSGTPTTLAGYGITDAATSAQGALADTALQPGDVGTAAYEDVAAFDAAGSAAAVAGDLASHENDTNNPHAVTYAQVGADPVGSAAAAESNANSYTDNAISALGSAAHEHVGTQPLELPRNTELASGAFAPYEPLPLYPITPAAAHTLTPDDAGKAVWSGAHDITLPDSAAPGMYRGWRVWIKNTDSASSLTIDCGGAGDTIDGGASLSLAAGESVLIVMIATGQFGSL